MNSKLWIKRATSTTLMVAIFATYSMVALAVDGKATGELIVNGAEQVTVNGEAVANGRTIFTSSMIATPQASSATLNLGKAGTIVLAPSSVATLSFNAETISLDLTEGKVSVLNSINGVAVNTNGKASVLAAGESASTKQDDDDDTKGGGGDWWAYALIFGGAAAGLLIAATRGENDALIGGSTTVVSPNR
jgi:hypothetical protein